MDLMTPAPVASATTAPLKVAVILASNREGRFAPVIADWFLSRTADRPDIETDLIDVADLVLPYTLSRRPGPEVTAQLAEVSPRLAAADAFVVVTPEYNHSFPAPLKNLIDWHHAEWQAKPVAFVSYGECPAVCGLSSTSVRSSPNCTRSPSATPCRSTTRAPCSTTTAGTGIRRPRTRRRRHCSISSSGGGRLCGTPSRCVRTVIDG